METLVSKPSLQPESPLQPQVSLEPEEFARLYAAQGRAIYYLALRFLGDPHQAEDATHDVFLKVHRKFGEFRGESSVRTWLYRITINHCCNLRQSWQSRNVAASANEALWEQTPAPVDSPFRVLATKELGERIQRALNALSDEYRLLLLLVADEEMSYDEVAQLTEQTSDAVRGKLHRARKAFAVHFGKSA